jgi:DUF438 domain-containing protein
MSATMSMNQVIHAAVRRDLRRLSTALQSAPDGDTARAGALARAYANLHLELKHHHQQEDKHVFPALRRLGIDGALVERMEGEHHEMSQALDRAATLMQAYAETASAADASAALDGVEEARVVVERHLDHEEDQLEPLMLPYLGSAEWKAAEKSLRKVPPTTAGRFFAWLTDGMDADSRDYLRSTAPRPVVTVFSQVLGRRYHREIAPVWRWSQGDSNP